ncbi:MAG: hypothetical protein MR210_03300 [Erysipelotrichaceae bacterium]|nr:hypothetical protein [Erysipelotrichaceae bacterium]MDY5251341.1 hypothetical protein [Erysipelotrichaceae bacterium]
MKIKCPKCDHILNKDVAKQFEEFEIGQISCPKCKFKLKRFVSETDLLLYFLCSIILYSLACLLIYTTFDFVQNFWASLIILIIIFTTAFLLTRIFTFKIYENAYFKEDLKNKPYELNEKGNIAKRLKTQFILFMCLVLFFGSQPQFITAFFIFIIVFFVLTFIKFRLCLKTEKMTAKNNH